MTDRLHSCKESPIGRHEPRTDLSWMCRHCLRRIPTANHVPAAVGWNVPAHDPDAHLGAVDE